MTSALRNFPVTNLAEPARSSRALDELSINTLRLVAVDEVEQAYSGHPGLPRGAATMAYLLWTRFLRHNPQDPSWPNLGSVALFESSLVVRRRGARTTGGGLAALGYAVSVAVARLGGNLVYGRKVGVDHTDAEKLPVEFTAVFSESSLSEGKPARAQHNGTSILLVRSVSRISALAETCSHLGGPLSEGKLDGDVIQCPWHGSRSSLHDGHVVDGSAVHPQPCLEAVPGTARLKCAKRIAAW